MLRGKPVRLLFMVVLTLSLLVLSIGYPLYAQDGVTINILMETVPDTDFVMELVPQFEEATGISVNIEVLTYVAIRERLLPQFVATEGAYDVIVVDKQWVGEFVGADWLLPLDDYIEADGFDTDVYVPAMFEMLGPVDGVTYMLPFYNYTMGLVYRTDVFEDAELQAEYEAEFGEALQVPTSVEKFVQVAKFLTRDDMFGVTQQLARGVAIHAEWANLFFSLDGWYYDEDWNATVNDEAGVMALEYMIDIYQNAAPEGATGYNFDEQAELMRQGRAAMMLTYSWMLASLEDPEQSEVAGNVAVAVAPGGHGVQGGWGWAIPRSAPNADAAWQFISWVESFDVAKERALMGGQPTRVDVFQDEDVLEAYPFFPVIEDMIAQAKPVPIFGGAAQMVDILALELSNAVAGGKDPQAALDDAAAAMDELVIGDPLADR
jgi:multiple sugar transport system substrate-binding protein